MKEYIMPNLPTKHDDSAVMRFFGRLLFCFGATCLIVLGHTLYSLASGIGVGH